MLNYVSNILNHASKMLIHASNVLNYSNMLNMIAMCQFNMLNQASNMVA